MQLSEGAYISPNNSFTKQACDVLLIHHLLKENVNWKNRCLWKVSTFFGFSVKRVRQKWKEALGVFVQWIFYHKCMLCCRSQHNAVLKVFEALNVLSHPHIMSIILCPLTYTLRSSTACSLNVPKVTTKKMRHGTSIVFVLRQWNSPSLFIRKTASMDRIILLTQIN